MRVSISDIKELRGDKITWTVIAILSLISLLVVYSSTGSLAFKNKDGNTEFYLLKHLILQILGFGLMYLAYRTPYKYYAKISVLAFIVVIPLLIYTILFGSNINQASRWITIPFVGLTLQSSDPAKLVLITFLAFQLTKHKNDLGNWTGGFAWIMGPVALVTLLILPANFSTAALIFFLCLVMMYVGSTPIKNIVTILVAGLIGVIILLSVSESLNKAFPENKIFKRTKTWVSRIKVFAGKEEDKSKLQDLTYQLNQSKIAIANGEITGVGPGNSKQRNFLPHPYSDFIYAIIVEEYGIMGSAVIIVLYLILFYRGIVIATKVKSRFGALLAFGLSLAIIIQATINVFVAQGLFPVTGQPLPLVSMGGTSMWFTCLGLGMLQSVCRNSQETEAEQDIYGRNDETEGDDDEYEYVDEDEVDESEETEAKETEKQNSDKSQS